MACPIPAEAPVTMATFPVSLSMRFLLFDPSCVRCCRISVSTGTDVVIVWMVAIFVPIGIEAHHISVKRGKTSQRMGRPRSFDLNKALDRALHLFWRKGYEGTSLSDLTKTMGINRPSLYAAFGDKEALFRKALERYRGGPAAYTQEALNETTARAVVERLLRGAADLTTAPRNPGGCLTVQGALACSEAGDSIRQELTACRAAGDKSR